MDYSSELERLGDEWDGGVYTVYYPHYDTDNWIVRNHTDEGLGGTPRIQGRGDTLEAAIESAWAELRRQ